MVLFDPSLNGRPGFSSVDCPIIKGNALYTWCFQAEVILHGSVDTGNILRASRTLMSDIL